MKTPDIDTHTPPTKREILKAISASAGAVAGNTPTDETWIDSLPEEKAQKAIEALMVCSQAICFNTSTR